MSDFKNLLNELKVSYPEIKFKKGDYFYWSPKDNTVTYTPQSISPDIAKWSLLHEVSHGILKHTSYNSDFELVKLEVAAWQQAGLLGKKFSIAISQDHVEDCLDTYRDWLHRRSSCPKCTNVSLQTKIDTYRCFNCNSSWNVSNSRFCRPYRKLTKAD